MVISLPHASSASTYPPWPIVRAHAMQWTFCIWSYPRALRGPEEACAQKVQSSDLYVGWKMPQNFFLKLSVLWLQPVNNFTTTECIFFPPFLLALPPWSPLSFFKCSPTLDVPVSLGFRPLAAPLLVYRPPLAPSPRLLTFVLTKFQPMLALTPRGMKPPRCPRPLFMTLSAADSSNFPLRGLLLF